MKTHPKDNPAFLLARSLKPKRRRGPAKAKTPEAVTQDLTEQYLDALGLPWFHLPAFVLRAAFGWNPHRSGAELGAMKDAAGVVRGLPDLLIFGKDGRCLPLELKSDTGKLNAAQRMWRAAIGTKEARSFDAAKAVIDSWLLSATRSAEGLPRSRPNPDSALNPLDSATTGSLTPGNTEGTMMTNPAPTGKNRKAARAAKGGKNGNL